MLVFETRAPGEIPGRSTNFMNLMHKKSKTDAQATRDVYRDLVANRFWENRRNGIHIERFYNGLADSVDFMQSDTRAIMEFAAQTGLFPI